MKPTLESEKTDKSRFGGYLAVTLALVLVLPEPVSRPERWECHPSWRVAGLQE